MPLIDGDTNPGQPDDSLQGTAGADTINGYSGNDTIAALAGADIVVGGTGNDSIDAGDGDDVIEGGDGADTIVGGTGFDSVVYVNGTAVTVNLATGTVSDGDVLSGIEGVAGSPGADSLVGDDHDNYFMGRAGNDTIVGGGGTDTLSFEDSDAGVVANIANGTAVQTAAGNFSSGSDQFSGIENLEGTNFADTLVGDGHDNYFEPGSGNDLIDGAGGFDTVGYIGASTGIVANLVTGAVTQSVAQTGSSGNDTLVGIEGIGGTDFNDTLLGDGNDNYFAPFDGSDVIDGGGGFDLLDYSQLDAAISATFAGTSGPGTVVKSTGTDSIAGIERINGTRFADTLVGQDLQDSFRGLAGNDSIVGGGGSNRDQVDYREDARWGGTGAIVVDLAAGTATDGFGDTDTLVGIENVRGSLTAGDRLAGNGANNVLQGYGGNDTLEGRGGDDDFVGGDGVDSISGGSGFDWINASDDGGPGPVILNLTNGSFRDSFGNTDTISSIEGGSGTIYNDTFLGSGADNQFRPMQGADSVDGGGGFDVIDFVGSGDPQALNGTQGVLVNLVAQTAVDQFNDTDSLASIEGAGGTSNADTFIGNAVDNSFAGFAGADSIDGGGTDDFDLVDYANDARRGGSSGIVADLSAMDATTNGTIVDGFGTTDQVIRIEGVRGTAGQDSLVASAAGTQLNGLAGNDTLTGGAGFDEIRYDQDASWGGGGGIVANLSAMTASNAVDVVDGFGTVDRVRGVDSIRGTNAGDQLTGPAAAAFRFRGLGGNDTITGGTDVDTIDHRRDVLDGGTLGVRINLGGTTYGAGADTIAAQTARDGFGDTDTLSSIENALGTDLADLIVGSGVANVLRGEGGADTLVGGAGNDTINGGGGVDVAVYDGARSDYTVTSLVGGGFQLAFTPPSAQGFTHTVTNVETFRFADGDVADSALLDGENQPPTIPATLAFSVGENVALVAASLPAGDPDPGTTLAYSIVGGADAALFSVNAATGALSFLAAPDFEAPGDAGGNNVYDVEVRVSDGTLSSTSAIAVTVTDVAETSPTVYTVANAGTVSEGGVLSFVVTRTGPTPSADVTYTLGGSATAPGDYTAPGGVVSFAAGQTQATVTLQTQVDGLVEGAEGVTLTLVGATAGGTVNAGLGQIAASGQVTDATGTFVPFDPASGGAANLASAILAGVPGLTINAGSVTYAGGNGQGSFYDGSIAGLGIGKGVLLTSGDGTPPTSNTSTFYGTDLSEPGDQDLSNLLSTVFNGTTASFDANVLSFTFTVTDPSVTSISLNAIFASDEFPDFVDSFVDVAAVFVNGVNYAFFESANRPLSLLGDNIAYFRDNSSGAIPLEYDGISIPLTVVAPVVQGVNTIKIAVADTRDGAYDSALFISSLSAGSEGGGGGIQTPPVYSISGSPSVTEGGALVFTITRDRDDSAGTVNYSLGGTAGAGDYTAPSGQVAFAVGELSKQVTITTLTDAVGEGSETVVVTLTTATNGGLIDGVANVATGTILDGNQAPVIAPTLAYTVAENATAVATLPGSDPDAGTSLIYSIVGGADASLFTIDAGTGALSFVAGRNFEVPSDAGGNNVYDVEVRVSDGTLSATAAVAVTVTDVNEAPVVAPTLAFTVAEGTTTVATGLPASDPDAGALLSYAIVGGADAALFGIDAATGALSFLAPPDFEAPGDAGGNNVYDVQVRVSDGTLTATTSIAVTVGNVGEAIVGTPGNDILFALDGAFTLVGLAGDDTYVIDSADDVIVEAAGEGTERVYAQVNGYTLAANLENLVLDAGVTTGSGNSEANDIGGNGLDNLIDGAGAADTLSGLGGADTLVGGAGADRLFGGDGDDSLSGGDDADQLVGGDGLDTLAGGAGHDTLWGEAGNDSLVGDAGDDQLIGQGGNDTMAGGTGNDSYTLDDIGDVIVEVDGEGTDTVFSSVDGYALAAGLDVLVLVGGAASGSGNAGANLLFGTAGANTLAGGAGADTVVAGDGADSLQGGADDDLLFGEGGHDTLDGGDGRDELIGGSGDDLIRGGAGADSIWGEAGNDTLDGGSGADLMAGGAGNDVYVVTEIGDSVSELAGEGIDTVLLGLADYLLGAHLENLEMLAGGVQAFGNELANRIVGNDADNVLVGGAGADTIEGGGGNDLIFGEAGGGLFVGGAGNDTIVGSSDFATDVFRHRGAGLDGLDFIFGYNVEEGDVLDLGSATYDIVDNVDSFSIYEQGVEILRVFSDLSDGVLIA